MNKKICPGCGWRNTKNVSICPDCGGMLDIEKNDSNETPFKMPKLDKKREIVITILIFLLLIGIKLGFEEYMGDKEVSYLDGQVCSTETDQLKITSGLASLKSAPYNESKILGYLKVGECYNIKNKIDFEDNSIWFYVETMNGTQGYIIYKEGVNFGFEVINEEENNVTIPVITTTKPIDTTTTVTQPTSIRKTTTTAKKTTTTTTKQGLSIGEIKGMNENFTSGLLTCKITSLSIELTKQNYSEILTINIKGKMKSTTENNVGKICNANLLFYDSENNLIAKHTVMAGPLNGEEQSEFNTFTFADVDYSNIKGPLINVKIEPFTFN